MAYRTSFVALFVCAAFGLAFAGCFGGDGDGNTGQTAPNVQATSVATGSTLPGSLAGVDLDELSTFKSKDPFIQQLVTVTSGTETTISENGSTTTTSGTSGGNTTTTYRITTTTRPSSGTTTTRPSGSTTSTTAAPTTTTTAPHLHMLKVLSIGDVGGAPAVTFKVDSSVYKDRRIGDVVSTSWGQIKVLDISTASKVVTFLHGSETLVLAVGQVIYE